MAQPISYSAAVSGSGSGSGSQRHGRVQQSGSDVVPGHHPEARRSPSPRQRPQGVAENEDVYVLTILTDKAHHERMTEWRRKYFPPKINKLEAHLTLFHALPASKLESSIVPVLEDVAKNTAPFSVRATKPFRLKKGIAISVPKSQGAAQIQAVHHVLQEPWRKEGFLSDQDAGGMQAHYTIMNKVDQESEVLAALEEVQNSFRPDSGTAEGLGLFRYDRGYWHWIRRFDFGAASDTVSQ
jgi:hypothetical protein